MPTDEKTEAMSALPKRSRESDQQAPRAIGFLLLATLALQISWVLPHFGVAETPIARHLVRMAIKWALLVAYIWMMRSTSSRLSWRELGFTHMKWSERAKAIALAVVLTAPLAIVFAASSTLQNIVLRNLAPSFASGAAGTMPQSVGFLFGGILFIIAVAFTAAFVEELFWRGYALAVLPGRVGIWGAVAIASALFGLTHTYLGLTAVVLTFAGGIALSVAYLWKRSLLLNIAIHFLIDVAAPLYVLYKP